MAKRILINLAKLAIVAVVLYFAGDATRKAWTQISEEGLSISPGLAIASGLAYLMGQAPMAWFWRKTLIALGQPAPIVPATVAFYISQIGKYVPGKGMVVVIRTERILPWGGRGRTIAATVFIETLTVMAVGAVMSALLLMFFAPKGDTTWNAAWVPFAAAGLGACFLGPTLPPVARWIIGRIASPGSDNDQAMLQNGLTYGLAVQGWGASILAWSCFALSIWLAACSVGATDLGGLSHASQWLLAASLPTVAGFLSLIPAGVLVREGLSLSLLAPLLGEANALAATLATRVIWVAAETLVCAILTLVSRRQHKMRREENNELPAAD